MTIAPDTWWGTLTALGLALGTVALLTAVQVLVTKAFGARSSTIAELGRRTRPAWVVLLAVAAVWVAGAGTLPAVQPWWPGASHAFLVVAILVGAWLVGGFVSFGFELLARREEHLEGAEGRRRRTQLVVIHRLALVTIAVLAVGLALFTFPAMRAVGTSVLASAGIASIVAGLAAQSILGNLIAGIQLAFTDAARVGDVVVVEGEWGRIGEINLSYVVVYIWDERRLVLPCSYFTSHPFETWTRQSDKVIGIVYMDLDWRVPMAEVRAKFHEIVEGSPAWDRRSAGVVVTGSQGGFVTVRFTMSSKDSSDQWVLRCLVREEMMTWLQREHPDALPTARFVLEDRTTAPTVDESAVKEPA